MQVSALGIAGAPDLGDGIPLLDPIPLFHEQIRRGGPVTITTAEMTRFLLSLDSAVDTVFAAIRSALPGETYIPHVPAARVLDVAEVLIDGREIAVTFTGIRPGEKIHEILEDNHLAPDETLFIGDMQHDIETARHGGIHSCAVLTGYNTLPQLRAAEPDLIVEHLDGQLHFAGMGPLRQHRDSAIGHCQAWIAENYKIDQPVSRMMQISGLASSTFTRRFRAATGYQPIDYVQALRVEEAKESAGLIRQVADGESHPGAAVSLM